MASNLVVGGQPAGVGEVCLLPEAASQQGVPFLSEEQRLLDVIAERVSWILERILAVKRSTSALKSSLPSVALRTRSRRNLIVGYPTTDKRDG